jgi:predicted permease
MSIATTTTGHVSLTIVLASLSASLEVFLLIFIGMFLRYKNIINDETVKQIAAIVFKVLTPCLYAYEAGRMLNLEILGSCYVLLFAALVYMLIGNLISRTLFMRRIWGDRIEGIKRMVLILVVTFGNPSSFPTVFLSTLFTSLRFFPQPQVAADTSVAYITLYGLSFQAVIWSYGMRAFRKTKYEEQEKKRIAELNALAATAEIAPQPTSQKEEMREESAPVIEDAGIVEIEAHPPKWKWIIAKLKQIRENLPPFSQIITPPMWGCFFGLFVAIVPKVQPFLFTNPPVVVSIFGNTLNILGTAMYPFSMITLGANMATSLTFKEDSTKTSDSNISSNSTIVREDSLTELQPSASKETEGAEAKESFIKSIIRYNDPLALLCAVALRLIIMPLFGLSITFLYYALGIVSKTDPVLILVLLVEASTPPANTINMLSILHGGYGIREICESIIIMYLLSPITLGLFSALYLKIICSFATGLTCV